MLTVWNKMILSDHFSVYIFSFLSNSILTKATSTPAEVAGHNPANLIGNDLTRTMDHFKWTCMFPSAFGGLAGGIAMLFLTLGWSSLIGLAVAFAIMAMNGYLSRYVKKAEKQNLEASDERIRLMKQAIVMMRGVKYFAWERQCLRQITELRNMECAMIRRFRNLQMLSLNLGRVSPVLSCLVTFILYGVVLGEPMAASDIFSALLIFQTLRTALITIPTTFNAFMNMALNIRRIEDYMLCTESMERTLLPESETGMLAELSFESCVPNLPDLEADGKNARSCLREFSLKGLSLRVEPGSLVAVLGPVGSGKSTLLSALLGALPLSGKDAVARTCSEVAFVPQKPIVLNATVAENVTMGLPFVKDKFDRAVQFAQLGRDLELLQDGRHTLVGERGTTLSGGQQMRVNLARAFYAEPDLLVMDDPLAALDHVVGSEVLKAICDYAAGSGPSGRRRAVVMALNQVHFLSHFSQGIWLDESGSVLAQGPPLDVAEKVGLDLELTASDSVDHCVAGKTAENVEAAGTGNGKEEAVKEDPARKESGPKAEYQEKGQVKASIYATFIRAMGPSLTTLTMLVMVLAYLAMVFADRWLAVWIYEADSVAEGEVVDALYPGVYAAGTLGHVVLLVFASVLFAEAGMRASKTLHLDCLTRVLRAPLAWFEDTPSGRTVSRFSTDLSVVDVQLTMILDNFFQMSFSTIAMLGIIVSIVPMVAVAVFIGAILYYFQAVAVDRANREMKRSKDSAMAPVQTNLSEALTSAALLQVDSHKGVLRKFFIERHYAYVDTFNRYNFMSLSLLTFGQYLTYIISFLFSATTAAIILSLDVINAEVSGLAFTYCFLVPYFLGIVSQLAVMTNHCFTSLERLLELCSDRLPSEAWGKDFVETSSELASWPSKGAIVLENVSLRYRVGLPLAVQDLSLDIKGGERIGIVGRTGAGKSSLSVLLFRLVEPAAGRVLIDGTDISSIGLHKLRSSIGMIPQTPVLVQGSLRQNLDPFGEHPGGDAAYRDACKRAQLGDDVNLDADISAGGGSLSQGEGQLISFARCLLRDTRIICLDEPTASVDLETDAKLQQLVRTAFCGRTLLCIAHRLQTIIDFDRILVMEAGRAAGIGSPKELLADRTSALSEIVDGGGGSGSLRASLMKSSEDSGSPTSTSAMVAI
eukprot:TRINITY_DN26270_c0_g2_i1.p1 TRINITY_DN26270_c0_g2~~TRINITY_DN26270_c0_g2_i1.p1  ORF type:complete len:1319 (+),score=256.05 TRINITY_DN26270_c0_g2_i1:487-3957(+)